MHDENGRILYLATAVTSSNLRHLAYSVAMAYATSKNHRVWKQNNEKIIQESFSLGNVDNLRSDYEILAVKKRAGIWFLGVFTSLNTSTSGMHRISYLVFSTIYWKETVRLTVQAAFWKNANPYSICKKWTIENINDEEHWERY